MKKLPIGISTLETIIKEDYIYIDKTQIALDLIQNGQYYFLSRPRRFGKSLFLDTLRSIFEAKQELFKGLYIYDKYEFKPYPVIRISFNSGDFKSKEGFKNRLFEILKLNQNYLDITCDNTLSVGGCFEELIIKAYQKYNQKVVILVDEYDKPILDNIENTEVARQMRDGLKSFYSVIKGADEFLKFVFITGVSKFSKVSLFSGLNNLYDITLAPQYATICGYTQNDVETSFKEHLKGQDFAKIREWYNGYKWLGEGVYNPFDILLFIANGYRYDSYWFSTATPTFLLKLIEKNNYFVPDLENIIKDSKMLDSFDVDYIELETLMWQTGYLTISKVQTNFDDTPLYHLDIPNKEVRVSLLGSIADFMARVHNGIVIKNNIYKALFEQDFDALQTQLTTLYASIPYHLFTHNKMYEYEGYYVSVLYAYIKSMGIEVIGEDTTNKGRIDLTLKLPHTIYIIEFKVDATDALAQIKDKRYYEKYLSDGRDIYLVGIEFDTKDRNISKMEWGRV
ncbi:MAG: hypothetical protein KU38_00655 [Sulfurovum sp. FS08-3]|nr:MAG: hypothetical protein KU38_00655 [Sulfurovum sp. FS08-3]